MSSSLELLEDDELLELEDSPSDCKCWINRGHQGGCILLLGGCMPPCIIPMGGPAGLPLGGCHTSGIIPNIGGFLGPKGGAAGLEGIIGLGVGLIGPSWAIGPFREPDTGSLRSCAPSFINKYLHWTRFNPTRCIKNTFNLIFMIYCFSETHVPIMINVYNIFLLMISDQEIWFDQLSWTMISWKI